MKLSLIALAVATVAAAPALAAGDAEKGAKEFNKCKACHAIIADDGTAIVKGGKTGPNLYGVVGRKAASEEGFKYGAGLVELGETGLVWDETLIAEYVADPSKFVKEKTGDSAAKSNMTFKLAKGGEDVAAYLASVKPAQ
ncbi:c-type cytochrome [Neotabrizicola shimadae]|uniref:Cytochrome C n=1 Tax=Neotabrizicola shimadae TaxID=2807096 RepID=A0A8G0ZTF9_9RHOB|nr:cytochrome C [Neotabrizicola shimadae]QYZ68422.1 cytochrome C [Neotabrizicola shimadae]